MTRRLRCKDCGGNGPHEGVGHPYNPPSQASVDATVKRVASEAYARVDADRKAKPKTRLLGHARAGDCVGPGSVPADTLEDTATGERTPLGWDRVETDHD